MKKAIDSLRGFFSRVGSFENRHEIGLGLLAVLFLGALIYGPTAYHHFSTAKAATPTGTNYAWASTVGWMSFSSSNHNSAHLTNCGGSQTSTSYGVCEGAPSGGYYPLSGYAWSENVGWISFNSADVVGCPAPINGSCAPRVDLTHPDSGGNYPVVGWARACGSFDSTASCNGSQSDSGGWTGWIHLSGSNYGMAQIAGTCGLTDESYAWGGGSAADGSNADIGWIHFAGTAQDGSPYQTVFSDGGSGCSNSNTASVSLAVAPASGDADSTNPNYIAYPGQDEDAVITLSTSNIASCSQITGGVTPILVPPSDYNASNAELNGTAKNQNSPDADGNVNNYPVTFQITCYPADGGPSIARSAIIHVAGQSSNSNNLSGPSCTPTITATPSQVEPGQSSDLDWDATGPDCGTCAITGSDGTENYGGLDTSGQQQTSGIDQTTTYTLTCGETGNTVSAETTVYVRKEIEI